MRRRLSGSIALKVLATLVAVSAFVLLYEATHVRLARSGGCGGRCRPDRAGARRASAVSGDRLLQGNDDRVRRRRANGHRRGRSEAAAGRQRGQRDDRRHEVQRRLHHHGHRARRCRDASSISTCGAATRRWRSAASDVQVTVLRLGWNPSASSPSLIDRLFRRREAARRAAPVQSATLPDGPVPETAAPRPANEGEPGSIPTTAPGGPGESSEGTDSAAPAVAIAGE